MTKLEKTYFNSDRIVYCDLGKCKKINDFIIRLSKGMMVFSNPPIVNTELNMDFIVFDHDAKIKNEIKSFEDWLKIPKKLFSNNYFPLSLAGILPLLRPNYKHLKHVS